MCKSSVRSFDGDAAVRAADERLEEEEDDDEDEVEEEEPDEPVDVASDADAGRGVTMSGPKTPLEMRLNLLPLR